MGFFDDPRTRRLKRDHAEMLKLQEESSILEFKDKGDTQEQYDVTFHGRCLAHEDPVKFTEKNKVDVVLGAQYPRGLPQISWKTPILHPNINGSTVCFGTFQMNPMVKLTEVMEMLWDIGRMALFNPYGGYQNAKDWHAVAAKVPGGFPTDPRILRDKSPAVPQPPPREASDEGDMLVISGVKDWRPNYLTDPGKIKQCVMKYLAKHDLDYDARVYTREEWHEREERFGNDALVTIVTEGPLYLLLNDGDSREAEEEIDRFDKFLYSLGLWRELGYTWSVHLYPRLER